MKPAWIGAVAALMLTAGCVRFHSAERIEGRIVDADSGAAVEGVVVVAHWQSDIHTLGGRIPGEQIMILEAVSDADGRFHFPAWGPRMYAAGVVEDKNPELLLFRPGYEYRHLSGMNEARDAQQSPAAFRMKRFAGDAAAYRHHLGSLNTDLRFAEEAKDCAWKRIPRMVQAVARQDDAFKRSGIADFYPISSWLKANETSLAQRGCGSSTAFLKGIQP